MKEKHFYFITYLYFLDFPDENLMKNKEIIRGIRHDRPCFYAFPDSQQPKLFWCIPISSRLEKYETIYQSKIKRHQKCNTIRFGEIMGQKRAFLIQNMFPITEDYISDVYIDRNTKKEVTIEPEISRDILKNAKEVLKLYNRGIPLVFPNIKVIREALTNKLIQQQKDDQITPIEEKEHCHWNDILIQQTRSQAMQKGKIKSQDEER